MSDLIDRQYAIATAISGRTREIDGERWIRTSEVRESLKRCPTAQPDVPDTNVGDLISRQAAIDAICEHGTELERRGITVLSVANHKQATVDLLESLPSAQTEQHYCRECKWSRCHANVDKHGKSEIYWRCLNWDGETEEEGFCHEWERRTDE